MANPIIPWIGGKRRLADHLIPRFPAHDCYVEVFAGGAALYFMRPPAKVEVVNDINGELINLYRVVQHHVDEFVRQFNWAFTSRELFGWLKYTIPETLTDIQRAARFYYLQKSCFGGKLEGQTFGSKTLAAPGLNPIRLKEELSVAHQRLIGMSMMTVNADGHAVMGRMHKPGDEKRSVVILRPADYDEWLHTKNIEVARTMLQLYPADEMAAMPK